ncbi:MAG TPA: DUF134 domain-containing protein [Thermoplasmata archaeon]|nr:DUF134 domain-containing protein [Thermoplasmata archaeon]HIH97564.1 DUF134 domain-containing protein [Thermoplasmata archaeon]
MPRPVRHRRVRYRFGCDYFAPQPMQSELDEIILKVEELESMRLKDCLDMDQTEAAERMGVSQPTFCRILAEARKKVSKALVEGKPIRVQGGYYKR